MLVGTTQHAFLLRKHAKTIHQKVQNCIAIKASEQESDLFVLMAAGFASMLAGIWPVDSPARVGPQLLARQTLVLVVHVVSILPLQACTWSNISCLQGQIPSWISVIFFGTAYARCSYFCFGNYTCSHACFWLCLDTAAVWSDTVDSHEYVKFTSSCRRVILCRDQKIRA